MLTTPFKVIRIISISLLLVVSLMTGSRLFDGFKSLLKDQTPKKNALDLKQRYQEVNAWFKGEIVYKKLKNTVYPPASMVILYPISGWISLNTTRVLWAFLMAIGIGWLIYFYLSSSPNSSAIEKWAIICIIAGCPSTFLTVFHGQLILFVLPLVLFSLHIYYHHEPSWLRTVSISILFTIALVKPTISAPFFLLFLFGKNEISIPILIVIFYLLLTVFALSFQADTSLELIGRWFNKAVHTYDDGEGNLQEITRKTTNFKKGNFLFSIIFLGIFSIWLYLNRCKDYWLLIGITAIFSRLWIYHRIYDNLLIVIGLFSFYQIWKTQKQNGLIAKLSLLFIFSNIFLMFTPGPLRDQLQLSQASLASLKFMVWMAMFLFLGRYIQIQKVKIKKAA